MGARYLRAMRFGFRASVGLAALCASMLCFASFSCTDQTVARPGATATGDDDDAGTTSDDDDSSGSKKDAGATSSKSDASTSSSTGGGDDSSDGGTTSQHTVDSGAGSDSIQVIVEPGDKGSALLASVSGAKSSVHLTMYLLTDYQMIDALIARQKAGVDVKVVLNETFPSSDGDESGSNASSYAQLKDAGVDVVWSSSTFTYTHEKCYVVDGTTAWIDTMNGTISAKTDNREYLVPDTEADDVTEAEAIFEADHAHTSITPSGKLLVSPVSMRDGLESLIASATSTLDFEVEEFDDTALSQAMCDAASRGVKVRGVLSNDSRSTSGNSVVTTLKGCKATLVTVADPYIHAKTIVVDHTKAYLGSANYSTTSLDQNRELGLVTSNSTAIDLVEKTVDADFTAGTSL